MNIKITGAEKVKAIFSGLEKPLKAKILKRALQLLAKPILESSQAKVWSHQRKGRLYRSLGQKAGAAKDVIKVTLGAKKTGKYRGWHAHFLENGTKDRSYISKNGVKHRTGKTKGIFYWSKSIEETTAKRENEYYNYLIESIEKEINSILRKSNKM